MSKLEKYDKQMDAKVVLSDENFNYYNIKEKPFRIEGLAWFDKEKQYYRLPLSYKEKVSEAVAWLSTHPAGGQVYFHTNSKTINIKVTLADKANMIHMSPTGQTGFDLYFKDKNMKEYQFFTTTKYPYGETQYCVELLTSDEKFEKDILINFPLYMGIKEVYIGLDKDATLSSAPKHKNDGKIVIYGTSVTQGGCACRPGMVFTNILSRKMDIEFINLGFSGSGLGEPIMAHLINEIDNVKMIILDYDANGGATGDLEKYMEEFVDILRANHQNTPILIITKPPFSNYILSDFENKKRARVLKFQKDLVNRRKKQDHNIYFYDGNKIFGKEDIFEGLVDGTHPTDLGFYRMYKSLFPVLTKILKKKDG